jgi:predicted type IV restriction endonuclease
MKKLFLASLILGFCSFAAADEKKAAGKTDKITGEVVDITCYANHGAKGEKHAACAQKCLSGGMPAGIVSDGKLWVVTMKDHSAPSTKLSAWAGKLVTAEGSKIERDGTNIFEIDTVAPAK